LPRLATFGIHQAKKVVAKHKLTLDDDIDFELIGVCSDLTDYRFCWSINQALGIGLEKIEDYEVRHSKDGMQFHSMYGFTDKEDHTEYSVIKNVSSGFKALVPEKQQIDYFMILKNSVVRSVDEIVQQVKTADGVRTAFVLDPEELKSKGNFIF
jgi:hypothetical protein